MRLAVSAAANICVLFGRASACAHTMKAKWRFKDFVMDVWGGMGGEASLGMMDVLRASFEPISDNVELEVIPKAGHWIADENPEWTAQRVARFLHDDDEILQEADFSALDGRTTLQVGFYGTNRNFRFGEKSEL